MDKVVHFELPVRDMARAKKFYESIFGWNLQDWPMPDGSVYVGVRTVPVDEATHLPAEPGAINGGMVLRSEHVQAPIFAINVSSIDDKVKQVEAAGGTLLMPKTNVLEMGFYAYLKDPEGNVIGLWEDLKK